MQAAAGRATGRSPGRGARGAGRALAPALCATGVALLVAGATVYARTSPAAPEDLGSLPAAGAPAPPSWASSWPGPWPARTAIYPRSRYGDFRPDRPAATGVAPVQVVLPGRQAAPVAPHRVGPDGELGLPDDVGTLAWWSGGGRLGSARGSVVLAGHVDGPQGVGYFAALRELGIGDRVAVRGADRRTLPFTVAAVRSHRKEALPAEVFAQDVPPRLVLITCTGAYDARTRSYEQNLVVYALPAP